MNQAIHKARIKKLKRQLEDEHVIASAVWRPLHGKLSSFLLKEAKLPESWD